MAEQIFFSDWEFERKKSNNFYFPKKIKKSFDKMANFGVYRDPTFNVAKATLLISESVSVGNLQGAEITNTTTTISVPSPSYPTLPAAIAAISQTSRVGDVIIELNNDMDLGVDPQLCLSTGVNGCGSRIIIKGTREEIETPTITGSVLNAWAPFGSPELPYIQATGTFSGNVQKGDFLTQAGPGQLIYGASAGELNILRNLDVGITDAIITRNAVTITWSGVLNITGAGNGTFQSLILAPSTDGSSIVSNVDGSMIVAGCTGNLLSNFSLAGKWQIDSSYFTSEGLTTLINPNSRDYLEISYTLLEGRFSIDAIQKMDVISLFSCIFDHFPDTSRMILNANTISISSCSFRCPLAMVGSFVSVSNYLIVDGMGDSKSTLFLQGSYFTYPGSVGVILIQNSAADSLQATNSKINARNMNINPTSTAVRNFNLVSSTYLIITETLTIIPGSGEDFFVNNFSQLAIPTAAAVGTTMEIDGGANLATAATAPVIPKLSSLALI